MTDKEVSVFKKILIANRGEIACRVIRTAQRMGIHCVAIYSEADCDALHIHQADSAYCVGPAPSAQSYLNQDTILSIAKEAQVDAIHPGYGFLSENTEFAERCKKAGIIFIGPPSSAIQQMGLKNIAKQMMLQAGVPILPGYIGDNQDAQFLVSEAKKIGFPILLKPSAGGGGKGMRVVNNEEEMIEKIAGAKREALSSFNDASLMIEKYLRAARHIEVQVFADTHGNVVHLFERDCSMQRRHQKVIEEASAPFISAQLHEKLTECAIKAARAVAYVGAGTIEFLVDPEENFYFLEMNTRLQVEHPVTEMITGLDLVEWQLLVAMGSPLPCTQTEIQCNGHAVEARLYAEDPKQNFLPATGELLHLQFPQASNLVRIDTGVRSGNSITQFYDPLLAKIITWGQTRTEALNHLTSALQSCQIIGVKTNLEFLLTLSQELNSRAAEMLNIHFIGNEEQTLITEQTRPMPQLLTFAALFIANMTAQTQGQTTPWQLLRGFRINTDAHLVYQFTVRGQRLRASINFVQDLRQGSCTITHAETQEQQRVSYVLLRCTQQHSNKDAAISSEQLLSITCNQQNFTATGIYYGTHLMVIHDGHHELIDCSVTTAVENDYHTTGHIKAPMSGTVISVQVKVGDKVCKGQALAVIEAMKMEHTLHAPQDGAIKQVYFKMGETVHEGAQIVELEEIV